MFGGLIAGGIGGLFNIASGLFKGAQADSMDDASQRPIYNTPKEIEENQKLAQNAAQNGMDGTSYNNSLNNINTNVSSGLNTLNQGRNGLSGVGNLVAQGNNATLNLDGQDAAIKRQNLQGLIAANSNSAEYADKAFQYNKADLYAQQQNRISQLRGVAQQDVNSGVNNLTSMGQSAFMSGS